MDPDSCSNATFNLLVVFLDLELVNPITPAIAFSFLAILVLVACSAVMSASEIAFFSITNPEKEELKESEEPEDKRVISLLDNSKYLLSTILIANNVVNIGVIIIFYFIITNLFNFHDVDLFGYTIPSSLFDFLINIIVVTFFIVLFGEAIPKVFATHNKLKIARFFSNFFVLLNKILYPITFLLVNSTSLIEKKIKKHSAEIDIEEINKAIEITTDNSLKSKNDTNILKSIVQFGNTTVKQIMRPRTSVAAIDIEWNYKEMLDYIKEHGYSRFPVFEDGLDTIKGIIYTKDLLSHLDKKDDFNWRALIKPTLHTPETKKIDDLLREFQESRKHMAVVVDEFGGTAGIITLEDVVEEVIGDIKDEFDEVNDNFYKKIDDHNFIFEGITPFYQFCESVGYDEIFFEKVRFDSETLSGFLTELKGNLPKTGDALVFENLSFKVLSTKNNRVERVKVEIK